MAGPDLDNLSALLDDAKCFALVRQHRWPDGVCCPACASGVPHRTIDGFELGFHKPQLATAERIIAALEAAGVELIAAADGAGGGVRLKEPEDLALRKKIDASTEMAAV